jgi:hypothetical protein
MNANGIPENTWRQWLQLRDSATKEELEEFWRHVGKIERAQSQVALARHDLRLFVSECHEKKSAKDLG